MGIKPMRVLHVVGGMDRGGAETMIMNIYRKIDREKIQFDFLCMRQGKHQYDEEITNLGGRIIHINPPKKVGIIKHIYEIISAIKKYGPFILIHAHTHFHTGIVVFAGFFAGVRKRICHSHSANDSGSDRLSRRVYFCIMRILIKIFATDMLACGHDAGIYLFGENALKSRKVVILPNAIDPKRYEILTKENAMKLRQSLNLSESAIVLGHVGRFSEQKNHEFFISLMEYIKHNSMKNIILVLVGDGKLRDYIQKLSDERKLKEYIKFIGIRKDIPELMNMFDVFIMPSIYEGLPVTLVEAQAAGTPCVVSDSITREADMGLNLIEFVSLNESLKIWVDKIMKKAGNKLRDFNRIKEVYKNRKYDINESIKEIEKIYLK